MNGAHLLPWVSEHLLPTLIVVSVAVLGGAIAKRLRIPGGLLTGSLIATGVASYLGYRIDPPALLRTAAIAVVGLRLGLGIPRGAIRSLRRALAASATANLGMLAAVVVFALLIAPRSGIDLVTAVLMTIPGGVSFIAALAIALDAEAPLVVVTHLIRMVIVVTAVPLIAARLSVRES